MDDEIEQAARDLMEELPAETAADLDANEVADRIDTYRQHDVSMPTALDAVEREFGGTGSASSASSSGDGRGEAVDRSIADLDTDGERVNIEVSVVSLWEPRDDSIHQTGLVGDETDVTKFTQFKHDDAVDLAEDESYRIENAATSLWDGDYNLTFNGSATVSDLDRDVEVAEPEEETVTITGAVVNVPDSRNGLIRREVGGEGRVVEADADVETELELRLKMHVDDGEQSRTVFFDDELTADLTGITLDEAKQIARDRLSTDAVIDAVKGDLLGHHFEIEAAEGDDCYFARSWERTAVDDAPSAAAELLDDMGVQA